MKQDEWRVKALSEISRTEIIKQIHLTIEQRLLLVELFHDEGWTIEEIRVRAKALQRKNTFQSLAFEHWYNVTNDEMNIETYERKCIKETNQFLLEREGKTLATREEVQEVMDEMRRKYEAVKQKEKEEKEKYQKENKMTPLEIPGEKEWGRTVEINGKWIHYPTPAYLEILKNINFE